MSDGGGLDVTLSDGAAGGYPHVPVRKDLPPMGPVTPPSDTLFNGGVMESLSPSSTLGVADEVKVEDEVGQGRLMRPEGRHHLIDIHGLAVFLRRSTRCLSCRNAFCLYVTGKISAQLAAVTQVKITCQKCNYTTSQTLSKPAGVPDSPSPQPSAPAPVPPPPPDTSTPPVPPPPPPYPQKPRHQTVIRLLKEENLTTSELLMKGKETLGKRIPSMPPLLPLQPIEKVWVKEEDKRTSPSKQEVVVTDDGDVVLNSLDPLLTEWCQLAGAPTSTVSSTSSPPGPVDHASNSNGSVTTTTPAASRSSPSTLQQCGSSPASGISLPNPLGRPQEPPDAPSSDTTILHRHLNTLQEGSILPKGISFPPMKPLLSATASPRSTVVPPSEGLFTILSGTPTPYTHPLASSLLQNNVTAAPDSPQLLQALQIKQKLEHDLEESLRLVRCMIQLDPDQTPASGKKNKETKSGREYEESPKPPQVYGSLGEAVVGGLHPSRGMAGDVLTEAGDVGGGGGSSRGRKGGRKCTAGGAAKSRSNKKENSAKKATRPKAGRSRKRGGEEDEGNVRKKKKSTKASSSQSSSEHQEVSQASAAPPAPPQCAPQTERCQAAMEQALYDVLKHSLAGGGKGSEDEEWQERQCGGGSHQHTRHHAPSCRCCSGPSSTTPGNSSALLSLKSSLETWGHAHRILESYSTRKRQRKGAVEASRSGLPQTSALAQLLTTLPQGTPPPPPATPAAGVREGAATAIPNHVLDNLQRNLSQLVHKNSLRLALRSLVRRNTSRTSKSRKYVKISLGVGEEEEEEEEEAREGSISGGRRGRSEREDRGEEEGGQEEGRATTWRFHDLLSSDSDSDPEDGKLVIDTEH